MLFAEEAAATASTFTWFDPFILLFTIVIAIGLVRLLAAPRKNLFAIGFTTVAFLVFGFMDFLMIQGW
jgi:arginine exporter protein ArgO